ncbi:MAG: HDOD domain-containing protein [Spirochaetota bacterium]
MMHTGNSKSPQIPLGEDPKTNQKIKVILADDSAVERMLLKKFILQEGFEVLAEADDGQKVINLFKFSPHKPQILFLDHDMPRKNGIEVIEELKTLAPGVLVVVITSHTEPTFINQLYKLQIRHMIVKPIEKKKLRDKLAKILGREDVLPKTITQKTEKYLNLSQLKIPSLPTVINKVLLFNVDDTENGTIAMEQLIGPDKGICANIIRISNSAFYGRQGKIKTIHDAITLIGVKNVRNIIILQHFRNVQKNLKGKLFTYYLLELPVLTALVGFDIATPLQKKDLREEIFLHALLYRIGMMVLAMNFSRRYLEVLNSYEAGIKNIYEIEEEEFGTSSVEIGKKVFELWKLPKHFLETIHKQKFHLQSISEVRDTDRIIRLSDILAKKMKGRLMNPKDEDLLNGIFDFYHADEDIKELFSEEYYEIIQDHPFFEMIVGV